MLSYRFLFVSALMLILSLHSPQGFGDESVDEGNTPADTSNKEQREQRSMWRFFDRNYLLEQGYELPGRFGAALFLSHSESELPIEDLKYGFDEQPLTSNPLVSMDDLSNSISNTGLILDYWVLPFVDLYTILGYSEGEMDTAVNVASQPPQPIPISFVATSYTFGGSVVFGYKKAFALLDYNYMRLDTNVYTNIIPVTNATIRAGLKFKQGWLPAMAWLSYIQTEFKGTFDLEQRVGTDIDAGSVPPGTSAVRLSFAVAKYDTWAIGGQWKLNKNFFVISELGFTTVKSLTVALNYRIE